jgi:hypothetical protein
MSAARLAHAYRIAYLSWCVVVLHSSCYTSVPASGGSSTLRGECVELIRERSYRMHFAVVLGGLAVGLLNFGDKVRLHFCICV